MPRPKKTETTDTANAEATKEKPRKEVIIGDTVLFFEKGEMGQKPIASIVVDIASNGCLELATIPKYSTEIVRRHNVHHYKAEVRDEIIGNYGAWCSREEEVLRKKAEHMRNVRLAKKREESLARMQKNEDDRIKILRLYDQGQKVEEITSQLTGWTQFQVADFIKSRNLDQVETS